MAAMIDKSYINSYARSDFQYLKMIGDYIKKTRLAQNITQAVLASNAGIGRSTLTELEKGNPVNLLSLIQVLRALNKLDLLNVMAYEPKLSPMQLAELEIKQKQKERASNQKNSKPKTSLDW